jgi:hypothetical protein
MGILDRLARAEREIQKRLDRLFGADSARTPLEVRRQILEELESRIVIDRGKRLFPFDGVRVRLFAPDAQAQEVFAAAFVHDGSLESDIRQLLGNAGKPGKPHIEIALEVADPSSAELSGKSHQLELTTLDTAKAAPAHTGEASLTVMSGAAEQPVYVVAKDRFYIGRLGEVLDKDGRLLRRNDLVFLDNGDEINSTVGRAHAYLWFNREKGEFRVVDEVSRYGTRVFRDNRNIEVSPGNPRGTGLRPGDRIYFGRACVRLD